MKEQLSGNCKNVSFAIGNNYIGEGAGGHGYVFAFMQLKNAFG
ncbi:hypothetical protein [Oceanobacillus timonensis]|nr:hypothetical protein [Oceanobacillus timonensis]